MLSNCVTESEWQVQIRNQKDERTEVILVERVGGDWTIMSESHESARRDATTFEYRVTVGPEESETVTYRVRVRWC